MSAWRYALAGVLALGCGRRPSSGQTGDAGPPGPPDQEPPVALNPDSPIQYPPRLYDQKVEGDVVLRLFVDSAGRLAPDSSKVAESSGYPALDSAALTGARKLRFAPARRHGVPVATAFLQPIEFHHPAASGAALKGAPDITSPRPPPPTPPLPPAAAPRVRADTSRPRPDTARARLDTPRARPDTTRARPDSGAAPH